MQTHGPTWQHTGKLLDSSLLPAPPSVLRTTLFLTILQPCNPATLQRLPLPLTLLNMALLKRPNNAFAHGLTTLLFILFLSTSVRAQDYVSYFTGDTTDIVTQPTGGICMMGGRTENDEAMRWFLRRADGGDVLVLRASGSDGYNDYLYTELGVPVNSVETIVFNSGGAAGAVEVAEAISGAEAIWFAGGNQANYVNYWRGTAVDSLIRLALQERNIVIGGTSAGMAILGGYYYSAINGGVTSEEALADPFNEFMTIESARFLDIPLLEYVITDTHFSERDREGRLATFLARASVAAGRPIVGIACDEYTAVCLTPDGVASVYGNAEDDDFAFFAVPGCLGQFDNPETLAPGQPLSWPQPGGPSLQVARLKGDDTNPPTIELNSFTSERADWQGWSVINGTLTISAIEPPSCLIDATRTPRRPTVKVSPNPSSTNLQVSTDWMFDSLTIIDASGRVLRAQKIQATRSATLPLQGLSPGSYYLIVSGSGNRAKQAFIVP